MADESLADELKRQIATGSALHKRARQAARQFFPSSRGVDELQSEFQAWDASNIRMLNKRDPTEAAAYTQQAAVDAADTHPTQRALLGNLSRRVHAKVAWLKGLADIAPPTPVTPLLNREAQHSGHPTLDQGVAAVAVTAIVAVLVALIGPLFSNLDSFRQTLVVVAAILGGFVGGVIWWHLPPPTWIHVIRGLAGFALGLVVVSLIATIIGTVVPGDGRQGASASPSPAQSPTPTPRPRPLLVLVIDDLPSRDWTATSTSGPVKDSLKVGALALCDDQPVPATSMIRKAESAFQPPAQLGLGPNGVITNEVAEFGSESAAKTYFNALVVALNQCSASLAVATERQGTNLQQPSRCTLTERVNVGDQRLRVTEARPNTSYKPDIVVVRVNRFVAITFTITFAGATPDLETLDTEACISTAHVYELLKPP